VFNPNQQLSNETQLMDELKQFTIRKANAEAVKVESEARIHALDAQRAKKDYDTGKS
jgi:hypothetical protein